MLNKICLLLTILFSFALVSCGVKGDLMPKEKKNVIEKKDFSKQAQEGEKSDWVK